MSKQDAAKIVSQATQPKQNIAEPYPAPSETLAAEYFKAVAEPVVKKRAARSKPGFISVVVSIPEGKMQAINRLRAKILEEKNFEGAMPSISDAVIYCCERGL